jgi:hypothetical protein
MCGKSRRGCDPVQDPLKANYPLILSLPMNFVIRV